MLLGIDIGSKYIKIVEGTYKRKNKIVEVKKQYKEILPIGVIEDGEIRDKVALKSQIRTMLKSQGFKSKWVSLTIDTPDVVQKQVEIPKVKTKDIRPMVEGEINEVLHEDREYVIHWEQKWEQSPDTLKLNVVAVPKDTIKIYKKLLEELMLYPVCITVQEYGIYNMMKIQEKKADHNIIVADIGDKSLKMGIFNNKELIFFRKVGINTSQCQKTLVSLGRLKEDEEAFYELDVTPKKLEEDLVLENIIGPYMNGIGHQLMSMIQFQLSNDAKKPVKAICIHGGMSRMKGIEKNIGEFVDVPVKFLGDVLEVECDKDLGQYYNAVTALAKPLDFLKTYKKQERENKQIDTKTAMQVGVIGGLAIVTLVGTLIVQGLKVGVEAQINQIDNFINSPNVVNQLNEIEEKQEVLRSVESYNLALASASDKIENIPQPTLEVIEEIEGELPQEVEVVSMSYNGGHVNLQLESSNQEAINKCIDNLRSNKYIYYVEYSGYSKSNDNKYSFNVAFNLVGRRMN